jgi:uncharacterized membrane protein (UPF0182 family)
VLALFIAAALFLFFPSLPALLTDWWWFREIGYGIVFTRTVTTKLLLFCLAGGLAAGVLYLNLAIAQRGLVANPILLQVADSAPRLNITVALRRLSIPIALGAGFLSGLAGAAMWDTVLLAIYRTPFGTVDPVFSRDVGFYVFTLPALSVALGFLVVLTFLSLVLVTLIYAVRGDLAPSPRQVRVEPTAALHIAILLAALLVLWALQLWLVDSPNLLYSTTGPLVGASYTDLHARLPALRLSAVVALLGAAAVLVGAARGRLAQYALSAIAAYVIVGVIGRGLVPLAMQNFLVAPTELTRETPYLRNHIVATRQAWGLDSVEVRELRGEAGLTLASIRASGPTIENVRLWDRDPLLLTFGQLQEIRTYYDFVSIDDDRYTIGGRYRQVLLSPRELNVQSLPTRTFINEHLTFTHGMGLTMSPVNQVTPEGLPVLFIRDLPPVSDVSLAIARPQIYFGELSNDYVIVKTRQREFDHPSGEQNVYASYTGKAGVPVGGLLRRTVFASRFGSDKILFSQDITGQSRVLYYRNVVVRARKALPFLTFDRDPYLVLADDGTLKWILDAYTTSDAYPYSERLSDGTSYMRNSVKLVIDAYDGSLTAYVSAPSDPVIRTWSRIFPGIFVPLERMPAGLRAHIRYPDEIFRIQTSLYATYHMDSPDDFYHREDQWQIPAVEEERGKGAVPFMRHLVMRLPEEKQAEYVYMVPFTPRGKDNLAAWMVARNDGAEYGRLRVYRLSRQRLVFGPVQIENRINQNTEISRQLSLWDQRGSRVIRGDLLVIPIEESLLYVQPIYLQAEGGRIPELKRVVVAYENQVVMNETLEGGLNELFGGAAAPGRSPEPVEAAAPGADSGLRALTAEARRQYDAALQKQRELQTEMQRLGETLEQIEAGGAGRRK